MDFPVLATGGVLVELGQFRDHQGVPQPGAYITETSPSAAASRAEVTRKLVERRHSEHLRIYRGSWSSFVAKCAVYTWPVGSTFDQRETYHHGDLRHSLVTAGVALARHGGAPAVTIREATRRVGVSPSAAYRHFADQTGLLAAVQSEALAALTNQMQIALDQVPVTGAADSDAWNRATALGHSYVGFAMEEPGLFSTAFIGALRSEQSLGPIPPTHPDVATLSTTSGAEVPTPFRLLYTVLYELHAAGCLLDRDIQDACLIAWAHVHGLAQLLLGPLADLDIADRDRLITSSIHITLTGLTVPSRMASRSSSPGHPT